MSSTANEKTFRLLDPSLYAPGANKIECLACARHCRIPEQGVGFCTAITNRDGALYSTAYGVIGEVSVTPIENRPVYHYRPGTRTLCLGGLGCNLRCAFCQNWEISFRDARDGGKLAAPNLPPEHAVKLALEQGCDGIAWTFNEPSISPMYTLDCAKLAHEAGLYTVMVTNGWMTDEALQLLGPYIDVYRIDIKSLDASFYRHVAGSTQCATMFPVAQRAQNEFNVHIETVTNLMPSLNDSDEHLVRLAERIIRTFGENTPWHLTSYVPYAYMTDIPPTPPEVLRRARAIGLQAGLRFVYTDDITAPETAHTFCPTCGTCVVERSAHQVRTCGLAPTGRCAQCNTSLGMIVAPTFISHLSEEV